MKNKIKKTIVRINFEVPVDLRSEAKQQAIKRNISLKDYLTRILIEAVSKDKQYD